MALCLLSSLITGIAVYATSTPQIMTISGGSYPGNSTVTVWRDGNLNYFAKNLYGVIIAADTDASTVIQYAIDYAAGDEFGTLSGSVYIQKGTYNITTTLTVPDSSNLVIYGDGMYSTWLRADPTLGATDPIFYFDAQLDATRAGAEFKDIGFLGQSGYGYTGVHIYASPHYTNFYRCSFTGFSHAGIQIQESYDHVIKDCKIGANYVGVWLEGNTTQAITILTIGESVINSNTYGIYLTSYFNSVHITNNDIEGNTNAGIWMESGVTGWLNQSRCEIDNNYIESLTQTVGYAPIMIQNNDDSNIWCAINIHNNHIDGVDRSNCINIRAVKGINIHDNTFLDVPNGNSTIAFNNVALCIPIFIQNNNYYNIDADSRIYCSPSTGTTATSSSTTVWTVHNLPYTPTVILVTPETTGLTSYYVSDKNATHFQITCDPSGTFTFDWQASFADFS